MSAEDYGYASYDDMIAHASHHGGGIDMDANAVEWVATELAALRQRVAELERERDMLSVEAKWRENYHQRLEDLRIMLGCSINDLPVKVKELSGRVAEFEAHNNTGKVAAANALDYLESLNFAGDCYQRLLNWYSTPMSEAQPATLTPNNCVHCKRASEKMREAAAMIARDHKGDYSETGASIGYDIACREICADISRLEFSHCDGCNPLAPKPQSQAALKDQLRELVKLANDNGLYDAADYIRRED